MRYHSAGEVVDVDTELPWVNRLVVRALGAAGQTREPTRGAAEPTVRLRVEAGATAMPVRGLRLVTRGAWSDGTTTVLTNAGGSGFDLMVRGGETLEVVARYRPSRSLRAANLLLGTRFGLLAGQMLVHYPVLWRAGWQERVPLHASVLRAGSATPLFAGPGGVGKSTVLLNALDAGAVATADNLCCADRSRCFGVAEPLRTDAPGARTNRDRTSHGRVEVALSAREPVLEPDRLVVLERGPRTEVEHLPPDQAARSLIAGTYAAGELRRYWAFAATLALATGHGPAHPPIERIAAGYAERLPCLRVRVGDGDTISAADLCGLAV
ncbi:hypothetical protein GCM10010399_24590 [Dactylosporangium fulvum]|uniref:Uncharacterized protein n=1 Tax=Dactylosporangium fulvum TaxID=53359 RepID=A0ABY5W910_9ACTN|nr:hypothetical protein [Dactylosporangium fulvum]UWP85499.1 hypothetical protein Dfulv_15160 [Dactylosporangium fulvum]